MASLLAVFDLPLAALRSEPSEVIGTGLRRESEFLLHPIFNRFHTETELLRYIKRLELRDLSLTTSMIPLGSCTMKLNAAAEMFPVTWENVAAPSPFRAHPSGEGISGTLLAAPRMAC